MEAIIEILFLFLGNVNIKFAKKSKKVTWRSYTIVEVLSTKKWVKPIYKTKFEKIVLNKGSEIFMVQIALLKSEV